MAPTRTSKAEWPVHTAVERRRHFIERNGVEPAKSKVTPLIDRERFHSQFVIHSVGALVAARLPAPSRTRARDEQIELEGIFNAMAGSSVDESNPFCQWRGKRRRLASIGGVRGRKPCLCFRPKRRRLNLKQSDTLGAFDPAFNDYVAPGNSVVDQRGASGHILMTADELTFCLSDL